MPGFNQHPSSTRTKLLVCGDPGSGKTTLLASLANAGYKVRVLDWDDGLDILNSYLTPAGVKNLTYATFTDELGKSGCYSQGIKLLSHWKTQDEDLGQLKDWGEDTVIAIDTLNFMAKASLREALTFNGRKVTDRPEFNEWGMAGRDVLTVLGHLCGKAVKCNVVINTHLLHVGDDDGAIGKLYPRSLTKNMSISDIGAFFNTIVRLDTGRPDKRGSSSRVIRTVSDFRMDLKNPAPAILPPDAEPDLAKIFEAVQANARKNQKVN